MRIEFDPAKSERNAKQRGLPFDRAHDFDWGGAVYDRDSRRDYPEQRFVALGYLGDRLYSICFTPVGFGSSVFARPVDARFAIMPKRPETRRPPLTGADGEVRQLTKADIARMRPARDVLPAELLAVLPKRRPGQRGSQKTPTKKQITLRLDERVIDHYRAQGGGWQSRINDDLKKLTGLR